jgi:hypothetical protein
VPIQRGTAMALRKTLFNLVIATLLAGLTPGTSAASDGHEILVGYKVKTHPRVSSEDAKRAKKHLEDRLKITQKAAPKLYSALRDKVTFWISDSQNQKSAATYHPSAKWLTDNKLDPAMAKGIEIMSIKNFVEWAKDGDQPMMVLHELPVAYKYALYDPLDDNFHTSFCFSYEESYYQICIKSQYSLIMIRVYKHIF